MKTIQPNAFIISLFLILLVACNKDLEVNSNIETAPRSAGDGNLDVLGYGYDITGEFATNRSVKGQVLNVIKLKQDQSNRVESEVFSEDETFINSGETMNAYSKNLSSKLKFHANALFGLAKTTITGAFSNAERDSSIFSYASLDKLIVRKRLRLVGDRKILRNYLSSGFKSDVKTLTAPEIVAQYGTHVLSNIYLGAKLRFVYQSQTSYSNKSRSAEAGLVAAVNAWFAGVDLNLNGSYTSQEASSNQNWKLFYKTFGGDPSKGLEETVSVGNGTPSVKINISNWQNSVSPQLVQLIDLHKEDGVIPIYYFIEDPIKRKEVKDYIWQAVLKMPLYYPYQAEVGDLIVSQHFWDELGHVVMIFPDRPRIIHSNINIYGLNAGAPTAIANAMNNAAHLKIFKTPAIVNNFYNVYFGENGDYIGSGSILYSLSSGDKKEILNSYYNTPSQNYLINRTVDLIRNNGQVYVRFFEQEPNKVPKTTIYPLFDSNSYDYYNLDNSKIINVGSIAGYEIGPYL